MDKRDAIVQKLEEQGLMPLYYHADEKISMDVMEALYSSGVRLIEYTNRGAEALKNFAAMKKKAGASYPGLFLGIGTIKSETDALKFLDAGADYMVSPALAEDVYDITYSNKILWIPGCMTPTEILKAEQFGINLVKLFPGNVLGPSFVEGIKDLFPNMRFMPTGGVDTTSDNLKKWFDSGVIAVGMGSKLISKQALEEQSYQVISKNASTILNTIREIKSGSASLP